MLRDSNSRKVIHKLKNGNLAPLNLGNTNKLPKFRTTKLEKELHDLMIGLFAPLGIHDINHNHVFHLMKDSEQHYINKMLKFTHHKKLLKDNKIQNELQQELYLKKHFEKKLSQYNYKGKFSLFNTLWNISENLNQIQNTQIKETYKQFYHDYMFDYHIMELQFDYLTSIQKKKVLCGIQCLKLQYPKAKFMVFLIENLIPVGINILHAEMT